MCNDKKYIKIIKYGADWCKPCAQLSAELSKLSTTDADIDIISIDIDTDTAAASRYRILSLPTLVFLINDIEVFRIVGNVKASQILKTIDNLRSYHF
jgi:thioredoxin 1